MSSLLLSFVSCVIVSFWRSSRCFCVVVRIVGICIPPFLQLDELVLHVLAIIFDVERFLLRVLILIGCREEEDMVLA